jgi:hypothetical protein
LNSRAPGDVHPALPFSSVHSSWGCGQAIGGKPDRLADDAAAEADCDRVRTRARLELRQQVPHVGLHRFLGQKQLLADLTVHQPVGNELQDLYLPDRRLLLELAKRALKRDHIGAAGTASPRRNFFEAARMRQVTAQDLLALRSIHAPSIGVRFEPL